MASKNISQLTALDTIDANLSSTLFIVYDSVTGTTKKASLSQIDSAIERSIEGVTSASSYANSAYIHANAAYNAANSSNLTNPIITGNLTINTYDPYESGSEYPINFNYYGISGVSEYKGYAANLDNIIVKYKSDNSLLRNPILGAVSWLQYYNTIPVQDRYLEHSIGPKKGNIWSSRDYYTLRETNINNYVKIDKLSVTPNVPMKTVKVSGSLDNILIGMRITKDAKVGGFFVVTDDADNFITDIDETNKTITFDTEITWDGELEYYNNTVDPYIVESSSSANSIPFDLKIWNEGHIVKTYHYPVANVNSTCNGKFEIKSFIYDIPAREYTGFEGLKYIARSSETGSPGDAIYGVTLFNLNPPNTNLGKINDIKHNLAFDDEYLYYSTKNYDGSNVIWQKAATANSLNAAFDAANTKLSLSGGTITGSLNVTSNITTSNLSVTSTLNVHGVQIMWHQPVPLTSKGDVGDKAGFIAIDNEKLYRCVEDYTDGANNIWKYVLFNDGTWG